MQFTLAAEYEETRIEKKTTGTDLREISISKGKVQLVEG